MRWVYLVLLVVIVTMIVVFFAQNRENETLKFFNESITAPLYLFFVAVYLLGMWTGGTVVGFVSGLPTGYRAQAEAGVAAAVTPETCRPGKWTAAAGGRTGRDRRIGRAFSDHSHLTLNRLVKPEVSEHVCLSAIGITFSKAPISAPPSLRNGCGIS